MLIIAVLGLLINLVAAWVLYKGGGESLNVKAALRHVLADLVGSIGVIIAALVIMTTGWEPIDALISIFISVLIAASAWSILRESVDVLLEAAPNDLDTEEIGLAMARTEGVSQVHDLHVWQITSGFPTLSAHVLVKPETDCHATRRELERLIHDQFEIEHTTIQVDHTSEKKPLKIEVAPKTGPAPA